MGECAGGAQPEDPLPGDPLDDRASHQRSGSTESELEQQERPARDVCDEAIETGLAIATVAEATLMTRPQPCRRMSGRNALHMSIGPLRLTAMMRWQRSKSRSSQVAASKIAALLTRMSTRPSSSATGPRTASIEDGSLMSSLAGTAGPPVSAMSLSSRSGRRCRRERRPLPARRGRRRSLTRCRGHSVTSATRPAGFVSGGCRHFICLSTPCWLIGLRTPRRPAPDRGRPA
jgi:hypothetical protein